MCIDFKIEKADQRFWSPHLSVQVSDVDEANPSIGSRLHCRYSPRPEIWTMFIAFYFVVLIVMFASLILAYVQWWMGGRVWALLMIPLGVVMIGGMHAGSQIGQSLSNDQMELLKSRFDQTLIIAGILPPASTTK